MNATTTPLSRLHDQLGVDLSTPRSQLLLALGDDELIAGHRASHWTGVAPALEEDLAFSTLAQDEINHGDLWFQVLVGLETTGEVARTAVDAIGLGRTPDAYRHAIVVERPPRDFAFTLATHWAYDRFDAVRLAALTGSSDADVAAVATKLQFEERYHLQHADLWFGRLTRGAPSDSLTRGPDSDGAAAFRTALATVLPEALGLAEAPEHEDEAVASGLLPVPHAQLGERWLESVGPLLTAVGLGDLVPTGPVPAGAAGGRSGRHSPDFTDDVWPEMTALYRADPEARW